MSTCSRFARLTLIPSAVSICLTGCITPTTESPAGPVFALRQDQLDGVITPAIREVVGEDSYIARRADGLQWGGFPRSSPNHGQITVNATPVRRSSEEGKKVTAYSFTVFAQGGFTQESEASVAHAIAWRANNLTR